MGGSMSSTPERGFQDRLARVADRRGPVDEARPEVSVLPDWRQNVRGPLGYLIAFVTGLFAVLAVRLIRAHFFDGTLVGSTPDLTMATDFAAGLLLSLAVFWMLPWKGFPFALAQLGGVLTTLLLLHNAVHTAPSLFRLAFTPEWTEAALMTTAPSSVLVRGRSLLFSAQPEDEGAEVTTPAEKKAPGKATNSESESGKPDANAAARSDEKALPRVRKMSDKPLVGN